MRTVAAMVACSNACVDAALQAGAVLDGEIVVLCAKMGGIRRSLFCRLAPRAKLLGLNLEHLVL